MRRLFIYLIVAILVIGTWRAIRHHHFRHAPPPHRHHELGPHDEAARREALTAEARRQAHRAAAEARRALEEASHDLRHTYREARDEVGRAYREARDEIRQAYREVLADQDGRRPTLPPPPPPPPPPGAVAALEDAEGLPVPIVPGTRVTEAEARPPDPAPPPVPVRLVSRETPRDRNHRIVAGEICASEDRARADARQALRIQVAEWLSPDVPASWVPPAGLLESMIVATKIDPLVKDYGTMYTAELTADFSPRHRAELVEAHDRELVDHRLMALAGVLIFILICLAALSGYIRADEATRGYYTNHLRMLAAAGVGAAGVIVYRMVV